MKTRLFACVLWMCLWIQLLVPDCITHAESADSMITDILYAKCEGDLQAWLDGELTETAGTSAEWYVLALAQYGENLSYQKYQTALTSYLSSHTVSSASSREKYALLLIATGSGDSYISEVLENSIGEQGVMSYVFGLHILNNGYTTASHSISSVTDTLLSLQLSDGGWAVIGTSSDVDVTAMVLQALAPQYGENRKVTKAIDSALTLLSERQEEDGDYKSYGVTNPESTAQVLTALSALGIDCLADSRFLKSGSLLDGLAKYRLSDGSYSHTLGGQSNATATMQVLYSLVAYWRMQEGLGSLYLLDHADPSLLQASMTASTIATTSVKTDATTTTDKARSTTTTANRKQVATTTAIGTGMMSQTSRNSTTTHTQTAEQTQVASTDQERSQQTDTASLANTGSEIVLEKSMLEQETDALCTDCEETDADELLTRLLTTGSFSDTLFSESVKNERVTLTIAESDVVTATVCTSMEIGEESDTVQDGRILISFGIILIGFGFMVLLYCRRNRHVSNYVLLLGGIGVGVVLVWTVQIQTAEEYYGSQTDKEGSASVHFSILCDTVGSANSYISENGVILADTEVVIEEGETVYDILQQMAREYGIAVDGDADYIKGIQYLYEFDYGDLSGWMYFVDGVAPSVACGAYELSDGEVVVWRYTCSLGKDLEE